ncbi:response regulator [Geomesophilobacter sediminis]|uniref:Response regulator n=1 Tax=Geomesophilobacter sediminis TaxID=2798584 RepID=A0A8J7IQS1_9BACT|nr:response regulator [Geomesophilobacter sediminis]MBJ6726303.1 response regulator [Geomesophilobacter sediminis]
MGLLIVDKDKTARRVLADLLIEEGYDVTVTSSAAQALYDILKKSAQVVLLGEEFDELRAADLIPLLKQCRKDVNIILVSDKVPLPLIRKVRKEGIFYHALRPLGAEGREEIRQAVRCALASVQNCHSH